MSQHLHLSTLGSENSAKKSEQGTLTRTVGSEQTIDLSGLGRKRKIAEDVTLATITK